VEPERGAWMLVLHPEMGRKRKKKTGGGRDGEFPAPGPTAERKEKKRLGKRTRRRVPPLHRPSSREEGGKKRERKKKRVGEGGGR